MVYVGQVVLFHFFWEHFRFTVCLTRYYPRNRLLHHRESQWDNKRSRMLIICIEHKKTHFMLRLRNRLINDTLNDKWFLAEKKLSQVWLSALETPLEFKDKVRKERWSYVSHKMNNWQNLCLFIFYEILLVDSSLETSCYKDGLCSLIFRWGIGTLTWQI